MGVGEVTPLWIGVGGCCCTSAPGKVLRDGAPGVALALKRGAELLLHLNPLPLEHGAGEREVGKVPAHAASASVATGDGGFDMFAVASLGGFSTGGLATEKAAHPP